MKERHATRLVWRQLIEIHEYVSVKVPVKPAAIFLKTTNPFSPCPGQSVTGPISVNRGERGQGLVVMQQCDGQGTRCLTPFSALGRLLYY